MSEFDYPNSEIAQDIRRAQAALCELQGKLETVFGHTPFQIMEARTWLTRCENAVRNEFKFGRLPKPILKED